MSRETVRRVLALNEDDRKAFAAGRFMDVSFADLDKNELQGLVVWIMRNKHLIGDWDKVTKRAEGAAP